MTTRPAPYPTNTRAKGWRFEIDMEQVRQSDTWALTPADARPWLMLLWAVAWEQTPCGSLPNSDALIVARLEVAPRFFAKHRECLMRGWWEAEDGRLYHDTLAQRVAEMMQRRRKESDRKALARSKTATGVPQDVAVVPSMSHGTTAGLHPESDTGTGTGTIGGIEPDGSTPPAAGQVPGHGEYEPPPVVALPGLHYARIAGRIRQAGIAALDPGYPAFRALVDAGATADEFIGFVAEALGKDQPFKWLIGAVAGERKRAAALAGQLHRGSMPNKQQALEQRNRAVGEQWLRDMEAADEGK